VRETAMPQADEGYIEVPGGKDFYRSVGEEGVPLLALPRIYRCMRSASATCG
jgi:hypothetical protein